jgi:hypothetical protein
MRLKDLCKRKKENKKRKIHSEADNITKYIVKPGI